jgi:hypothetical protein
VRISQVLHVNAYIMLGDPAYLAASVSSYYDVIDRLIVSYDEHARSWSGDPIPVDECLAELTRVDRRSKATFFPGSYSQPHRPPLVCDTLQRQSALDEASAGADWVLQLDTDEVIPDLATFAEMLERAKATGAIGMDFPSRWLYARTRRGLYLEACSRWWRVAAGYPGPLAVRTGAILTLARQCDGPLFRVDFRHRNTDPWHARGVPVHATIHPASGVLHFSWVRLPDEMAQKSAISGHRDDFDWDQRLAKWLFRQRHPILAVALTPVRRRRHTEWLRQVRLPLDPAPRMAR